jgi:hypothetical protein
MDIPVSKQSVQRRRHRSPALAILGRHRSQAFLQSAVARAGSIRPRVINVDGRPAHRAAVGDLKRSGELSRRCRCRRSRYINNRIEQDHRFVKKRVGASRWFQSVDGALNTIAGYEAVNIIPQRPDPLAAVGRRRRRTRFIERTLESRPDLRLTDSPTLSPTYRCSTWLRHSGTECRFAHWTCVRCRHTGRSRSRDRSGGSDYEVRKAGNEGRPWCRRATQSSELAQFAAGTSVLTFSVQNYRTADTKRTGLANGAFTTVTEVIF